MTSLIQKVSSFLKDNKLTLVTAESCTGGWVAKAMTDLAGSSAYFDRGFVTYTNQAKQDMLGVSATTLEKYGAVSEPVVVEMATGALQHSPADVAVAISGIAGPTGGTKQKPVGTVCFAWLQRNQQVQVQTMHFSGDRNGIRQQSVEFVLDGIIHRMDATP